MNNYSTQKTTKPPLKTQSVQYTAWENMLHLQTLVEYQIRGQAVGAYLLKRSNKSPYTVVFGFDCPGIHSLLSEKEFIAQFQKLENSLKQISPGFRLTFHLGVFNSDSERQAQLDRYLNNINNSRLKLQIYSQKATTSYLARLGLREPKFLRIFVTWEAIKPNYHRDISDRMLDGFSQLWIKFAGKANRVHRANLYRYLDDAYVKCYTVWQQLLTNAWGLLQTRPLSATEMWSHLWHQVNGYESEPSVVPQILRFSQNEGLTEIINSQKHAATLVAKTIPEFHRDHVRLGKEHLGILSFWEKPGGWETAQHQLHYLWRVIATELVTNTEIVAEITTGNLAAVSRRTQLYTQQQKGLSRRLDSKGKASSIQDYQSHESESAQLKLNLGEVPLYVGVVLIVRRPSLSELRDACAHLALCFPRPAWVCREEHIAWMIWRQMLPVVDERLLGGTMVGNRLMYLSGEVLGFLPLIQTKTNDRQGVEFIAEDGSSPVAIDLTSPAAKEHRNVAILGQTRSGKSVVLGAFLLQALLDRVPAVVIDYPKGDGTSTFTGLCEFHPEDADYLDVRKSSINIFDRPDLALLSLSERRLRMQDYLKYVCDILTAIVTKGLITPDSPMIRDLIALVLDSFYNDASILEQFRAAEEAGFGGEGWQTMPTLVTFHEFFCALIDRGFFDDFKPNQSSARTGSYLEVSKVSGLLEQIRLSLAAMLRSPLATTIARPSSVRTDKLLTVFAMANVNSDDVAILSLVAYARAIAMTLTSPISLVVVDEAPIIFRYESLVRVIAALISNGAKSGIRVILSAQDVATIGNSAFGSQILNNINTVLIGRVQESAPSSFNEYLGYPTDLVSQCCGFLPNPIYVYTNWLVYDINRYVVVRYYSPPILLALVANNTYEVKARKMFLEAFGDDIEAIAAFAEILMKSFKSKQTLEELTLEYLSHTTARPRPSSEYLLVEAA